MKEVKYWIADDGKRFDSLEECKVYEENLEKMLKNFNELVRMYDSEMKRHYFENEDDLEDVRYLWVANETGFGLFNKLDLVSPSPRDCGYEFTGEHWFIWDDTTETWRTFEEVINKLEQIKKTL
jgi:hypothetical protein